MAIQKNFVVNNGIEVNKNLIFADKTQNKVGIGTTIISEKFQVNGGIGATSLVLSGVGTIPTLESTNGTITTLNNTTVTGSTLNYNQGYIVSGVVTSLSGNNLNYTGISTFANIDINGGDISGVTRVSTTNLNATGISTLGVTEVTTLNATGISTLGVTEVTTLNATGIATLGTVKVSSGIITATSGIVTYYGDATLGVTEVTTLNATGISTFANIDINGGDIDVSNVDTTDLYVTGISTLGTVKVSSGIITATSGIVTYYGDGANLTLAGNPDLVSTTGIGIGTTGGLVGYGITFLDLKGAGVSTSQYNSSVGIATIFFEGGGGGGSIGIGSTFPGTPASVDPAPNNGDLFFHIDYARTFIYYDEVTLGVGSSAFWIDSSPFNIGIITALSGGISFSDGTSLSPSWYFSDDQTTGVFSPTSGEITFVSTASSILNINQSGSIVTGIVTATGFVGDLTGTASTSTASATAYGLSGTPNLNVGVVTATSFVGNLTGTATGLSGTPNVTVGVVTATSVSVSGNVSIAGTLTYEDVTNVDSIGLITARSGIQIGNPSVSIASTLSSDGSAVFSGIVTAASFSGNATSASTSNQIKTNSTATAASHYLTFVDSNNGSPTSETLYTDAGIIYNPSTNDLTASGNVTAYSDITLKENIETISNALEIVKNLRGVRFNRKDLEGNPLQVGVIAQEIEEIIPEVVTTHDDGIKSVAYGNLIGILIEAVKELSEEVDRLKNN